MASKEVATRIVKKLKDAGHIAYFAGGWVRDYLMNWKSDDIDIATSASTDEVCTLFPKTIPVGINFGIIIVVEEGHQFEVATFRKEEGYKDGRRPTSISSASPEEDAQRRDFTINGMFFDPIENRIYDYVKGQEDIKRGIIKAIGNAKERFMEDRLRMMRAVRYSTRFNFVIDGDTVQAIVDLSHTLLPSVAMERVWQEFKKMSQFAHFAAGLVTLHKLELLPTIFPQLKEVSIEEIKNRVAPIENYPKGAPTVAELIELFPGASLEELLDLCDYLKLSKQERDTVTFLHRTFNLFQLPQEWLSSLEKVEWAHYYAHPLAEMSLNIFGARLPFEKRQEFLEAHHKNRLDLDQEILRIQNNTPLVSAKYLMDLGVKPGKHMGILLKEAEKISINENVESRDEIIARLKESPYWTL